MTRTVLESKTKTVVIGFDEPFCVIGERINPTGRKKLAAELEAGNFETVLRDALEQVACGATVLDVGTGDQACGETGDGRMLEPPELVEDLVAFFQPKLLAGHHVLVTAGPTYEAIDPAEIRDSVTSAIERMTTGVDTAPDRDPDSTPGPIDWHTWVIE